jgi:hypothetical protein
VPDDAVLAPLLDALADAGSRGWRPVDVERALRAGRAKAEADLVAVAARGFAPVSPDPRLVDVTVRLVRALGPIPPVVDRSVPGVDDAVLAKVRALLAKAESTTFEAEAEALVAKAHELMVRNAIDEAAIAPRPGRGAAGSRRVFVDDPYATAKGALLGQVALACSCRAVHWSGYGFATAFGHEADLEAVELLYTSLLVQATGAVLRARPPGGGRSAGHVKAYRRAWLFAFAQRIGERLADARDDAVSEASADHGRSLVPVLAARDAAAEAAMRAAVPRLRTSRARVSSGDGWVAGRAAGDRAALAGQAPLPKRPGALSRG